MHINLMANRFRLIINPPNIPGKEKGMVGSMNWALKLNYLDLSWADK